MFFNMDNSNAKNKYQTRQEYVDKLKQWLDEARLWHGFCASFPYYTNLQNQTENSTWNVAYLNRHSNRRNLNVPVFQPGIHEFVIPPLWKRIVAEFLDFLILLLIKMVVTFVIIECFYVLSIENYRFDSFKKNLQDPKIAMQMSVEILTLELLHRFIVCCYEVYWLKGGSCATPGKKYMGLMVIQVENITPVPGQSDDVVRVSPCLPLGIQKAIIRAILKNVFLGVMLPMCFTLYVFRFNRTGYDAMSNSLVVECNPQIQFHVQ
ncbi:protein FAM8A1 [Tribolium castaneum]|nr:PREDICTED: protein FAM8A1 [Tribolium castaneum]|eukprot:XP_008199359.1 PREDICTED: protein FAM8A1 [Tribolium castaneum]